MKHVMLDTECIGFPVQIGACVFDDNGNVYEKFLVNCSMSSALNNGLQVDAGELEWWFTRKEQITWLEDVIELKVALLMLKEFIKPVIETSKGLCKIFCHSYDIRRLESACCKSNVLMPFAFRQHIDIRTLVSFYSDGKKAGKRGSENDPKTHNALEDCIYQVGYVSKALQQRKIEDIAWKMLLELENADTLIQQTLIIKKAINEIKENDYA